MQRLRASILIQIAKQAHSSQVVNALPGPRQLAARTICAVASSLPSALPVTSLINLRSFAAAAEPCRVEDQQSAAEALFKAAEDRPATLYQPATFPFFARAYYVGMQQ